MVFLFLFENRFETSKIDLTSFRFLMVELKDGMGVLLLMLKEFGSDIGNAGTFCHLLATDHTHWFLMLYHRPHFQHRGAVPELCLKCYHP